MSCGQPASLQLPLVARALSAKTGDAEPVKSATPSCEDLPVAGPDWDAARLGLGGAKAGAPSAIGPDFGCAKAGVPSAITPVFGGAKAGVPSAIASVLAARKPECHRQSDPTWAARKPACHRHFVAHQPLGRLSGAVAKA